MGPYILTMSCISGDAVQVAIQREEDIIKWLRALDHEGSTWDVVHHLPDGDVEWITDDVMAEYENGV